MKITIKARFTDSIKIEGEYESTRHAAENNKADLREANLWGANLWGANLWGANLREANLREANLWGANLREANLWGANLWGANLREADLRGADLRGADLREADLREADLRGANLREADLRGAKIDGVAQTKNPIQIGGLKYQILITEQRLIIGCKTYEIKEWAAFDDAQIAAMDVGALDWWNANREWLLTLANAHYVEPKKDQSNAS